MPTYTPDASNAEFESFTGIALDDPVGYSVADSKRLDAKFFGVKVQNELLNLIALARKMPRGYESAVIDFKVTPADYTLTPAIPTGKMLILDRVELIATNITGYISQPSIRVGIVGDLAKYLDAQATTLLQATGDREIYTLFKTAAAVTAGQSLSVGFTAAASAATFKGQFLITGRLINVS